MDILGKRPPGGTRPHQGKLSLVEASPALVRPSPGLTRGLEPLVDILERYPPDAWEQWVLLVNWRLGTLGAVGRTRPHQGKLSLVEASPGLTSPGETFTRAHQGFGTPGGHYRKMSTRGYHCTRPHQGKLSLLEDSSALMRPSPVSEPLVDILEKCEEEVKITS